MALHWQVLSLNMEDVAAQKHAQDKARESKPPSQLPSNSTVQQLLSDSCDADKDKQPVEPAAPSPQESLQNDGGLEAAADALETETPALSLTRRGCHPSARAKQGIPIKQAALKREREARWREKKEAAARQEATTKQIEMMQACADTPSASVAPLLALQVLMDDVCPFGFTAGS